MFSNTTIVSLLVVTGFGSLVLSIAMVVAFLINVVLGAFVWLLLASWLIIGLFSMSIIILWTAFQKGLARLNK